MSARTIAILVLVASDAHEPGQYLYGVKYSGPNKHPIPGLDLPTDEPNERLGILDWNKRGGFWEDGFNDMGEATVWGGRRAVNHFHDPLTGSGGYTGVTAANRDATTRYLNLARAGISVTEWVMNGQSGGEGARFGRRPVPLSGDAQLPLSCNIGQVSMVWPAGNGEVLCAGFAPTGLSLFHAENTMSMSQCSGSPQPPSLPRTVDYKRIYRAEARMWMKEHFGITQLPMEWVFRVE